MGTEGAEADYDIGTLVEHTIHMIATLKLLVPILEVVPLQFLVYHIASSSASDVDKPRNWAKSVTVE